MFVKPDVYARTSLNDPVPFGEIQGSYREAYVVLGTLEWDVILGVSVSYSKRCLLCTRNIVYTSVFRTLVPSSRRRREPKAGGEGAGIVFPTERNNERGRAAGKATHWYCPCFSL